MTRVVYRLRRKTQLGANAVEYGLVMAIIVGMMLAAASAMQKPIEDYFELAAQCVRGMLQGEFCQSSTTDTEIVADNNSSTTDLTQLNSANPELGTGSSPTGPDYSSLSADLLRNTGNTDRPSLAAYSARQTTQDGGGETPSFPNTGPPGTPPDSDNNAEPDGITIDAEKLGIEIILPIRDGEVDRDALTQQILPEVTDPYEAMELYRYVTIETPYPEDIPSWWQPHVSGQLACVGYAGCKEAYQILLFANTTSGLSDEDRQQALAQAKEAAATYCLDNSCFDDYTTGGISVSIGGFFSTVGLGIAGRGPAGTGRPGTARVDFRGPNAGTARPGQSGHLRPGRPAPLPRGTPPQRWTNNQLQTAADTIHNVIPSGTPGRTNSVTTVTVATNGRVVISANGRIPSPAQRAVAEQIFGSGNVEFVRGTTRTNAPGPGGHHAEARAIEYLGVDANGSRQASSHFACNTCDARQLGSGVNNVTGSAAQNGGNVTRPLDQAGGSTPPPINNSGPG